MAARILIVEDDKSFARIAQLALKGEGYDVTLVHDVASAKEALEGEAFDCIVTDLKLPDEDGVSLLKWINDNVRPSPPVLIMTAYATIQTAVSAMKQGAADYLTKPFSNDELILAVAKAIHVRHLEDENRTLREALVSSSRFENIVGRSKPIQDMFELMRKAAPRDVNVLIRGESGTGKELVARAIHFASSRSDGPFVPVDSGAIPEHLLESELFGHVKGAFTGAIRDARGKIRSAQGGTIFLDEIGDMSVELQVKLLRVLQERVVSPVGSDKSEAVDVRVIAATHVDLEKAVKEGRFREDLFFRLNVISIRVPPLRDRKDDIPMLVRHFISEAVEDGGMSVSDDAMQALVMYDWPGNVRELQNAIEHAVVVADGDEILPKHLPDYVIQGKQPEGRGAVSLPEKGLKLEDVERELIRQALERTDGNQTRAAELLGISRPTLIYRVEKYGISRE
jgi:DNA-binding NtrC family response regulator